jgi:multimeric flavodoxin WrbA
MYILGIGGSPRKGGFTDMLLDSALNGASSEGCHTEKIFLNDLDIRPCQDCGSCADTGVCVVRDDMLKVREGIAEADRIIIASPVYFGSVTAQVKTMVDRYQDAWTAKYVLKYNPVRPIEKKGAFICVAAEDKIQYFENSRQIIKNLFATLDIEYHTDLFVGGTAGMDALAKDETAKKAFHLGAEMVRA